MSDKILITGGCGFIGANLAPKLVDSGWEVVVLDNLSRGRASNLEGVKVEIVQADIRDREQVTRAIGGCQAVIHLAAFGSVIESVADPAENFDVNARGTLCMLEAAVAAGVRKFILASTGGALIGNVEPPVHEESLPRPVSPYGASKLCAEAYCHAFSACYNLPTVALRFANVYGPHSAHKRGAITTFMRALISGNPIIVYGDGSATRDFLHVNDLSLGIIRALETQLAPGVIFHLASGTETAIDTLVQVLLEVAGRTHYTVRHEPSRPGEVHRNFANIQRARRELGFNPAFSLSEGLRDTWKWFLAQQAEFLRQTLDDT